MGAYAQPTHTPEGCLDILVVDGDSEVRRALALIFTRHGHQITAVSDGRSAIDRASTQRFDLILLEAVLGFGPDGFEVCRTLRGRYNRVPIIMHSSRRDERDVIRGLEAGADDYVRKPCGAAELRSRARAVLRRASGPTFGGESLCVGPFVLSPSRRYALMNERELGLTFSEFELLATMMARPNQVWRRPELASAIWSDGEIRDQRGIDSLIRRLRRKIEPDPSEPAHLITVREVGYRLMV